uniref:ATP synthase complex subunit 8 n=1 Tax=Chrysis longula TaxID=913297 RepID=A0A1D9CJJ0_9HYME|nr:ATP synthase subunit 8 [Chrysis longula]AOY36448.1 ATP synthase subunit 8 [Chrysis longula]AOY36454.1 ATP synthase subunit 8 [Chrysis longula]
MPQMSPMNWMILMFYFLVVIYLLMVKLSYMNFYYIEKGEINKINIKNFKNKW